MELIILCTGKDLFGKDVYRRIEKDGIVYHRFFWQSNKCIWNNEGGDRAWLIKYDALQDIEVLAVEEE